MYSNANSIGLVKFFAVTLKDNWCCAVNNNLVSIFFGKLTIIVCSTWSSVFSFDKHIIKLIQINVYK